MSNPLLQRELSKYHDNLNELGLSPVVSEVVKYPPLYTGFRRDHVEAKDAQRYSLQVLNIHGGYRIWLNARGAGGINQWMSLHYQDITLAMIAHIQQHNTELAVGVAAWVSGLLREQPYYVIDSWDDALNTDGTIWSRSGCGILEIPIAKIYKLMDTPHTSAGVIALQCYQSNIIYIINDQRITDWLYTKLINNVTGRWSNAHTTTVSVNTPTNLIDYSKLDKYAEVIDIDTIEKLIQWHLEEKLNNPDEGSITLEEELSALEEDKKNLADELQTVVHDIGQKTHHVNERINVVKSKLTSKSATEDKIRAVLGTINHS